MYNTSKPIYSTKKKCMIKKMIGYSLGVILIIAALLITNRLNHSKYTDLDLFGLILMTSPIILLNFFGLSTIWLSYYFHKFYIEVYSDHIEGQGILNEKITYFYIPHQTIMHVCVAKEYMLKINMHGVQYKIPLGGNQADTTYNQILPYL